MYFMPPHGMFKDSSSGEFFSAHHDRTPFETGFQEENVYKDPDVL